MAVYLMFVREVKLNNKVKPSEALEMAGEYISTGSFKKVAEQRKPDQRTVAKHVRRVLRRALELYKAHLELK